MTCILIRRGEDTQKEDDHVKMEAEIAVMHLQAKEWQRLLRVSRCWHRQGGFFFRAFRENMALMNP